MPLAFQFKDKYGAFTLERQGNIAVASFSGSLGNRLTREFANGLALIGESFKGQPWAYLSNSPEIEATTIQGEKNIIASIVEALSQGCVVDAYVLGTSIARAQVKRVRVMSGIETPFESVSFDSKEDALQDIQTRLQAIHDALAMQACKCEAC